MSIDLVLSRFDDGRFAPLPTRTLLAPFAGFVARTEPNCLLLRFDSGQESLVFIDTQAAQNNGLTVSRPVREPALYAALHSLLRTDGMVLLVPGDVPPLVGSPATAGRLPAGMCDTLGAPVLLAAPEDLQRWVEQA